MGRERAAAADLTAGRISVQDADVAPMIDAALRNQPAPALDAVMPWSTSDVLLARPIGPAQG
ncbi:hypothetical protein GCM10018954_035670 [Kutzneria kofuensis]